MPTLVRHAAPDLLKGLVVELLGLRATVRKGAEGCLWINTQKSTRGGGVTAVGHLVARCLHT